MMNLEEQVKSTAVELKNSINREDNKEPMYVDVIKYLNEKCKTSYKYTVLTTKMLINSRIKEGYGIKDFKKVIDKKYISWAGTTMGKYLRPETLFGTKFEGYINEINLEFNTEGQANGWNFYNYENNRQNHGNGETEKPSRWSQGENINNRSLTEEEREWAERELF